MSEQSKSRAHTKLLDALGEQIEQIMQSAEEQATEIVAAAERESARRLEDAELRANSILAERAAWLDELHSELVERAGSAHTASLDFVSAIHDAARQLRDQPEFPSSSGSSADDLDQDSTPMRGEAGDDTNEKAGTTEEIGDQTLGEESTGELENLRDRLRRGSRKPTRLTRANPDKAGEAGPERTVLAKPSASPRAPEGAMLLATQMAVSGSSREEIERRLRDEFQITDTTPILDSLLDERSA